MHSSINGLDTVILDADPRGGVIRKTVDLLAILKKNLNRTTFLHIVEEFSNVHNSGRSLNAT